MIEQLVLASILIEPKYIKKCILDIEPTDFSDFKNKEIYKSMLRLADKVIAIDYRTLLADLEKHKSGVGIDYLLELVDMLPTAENLDSYVESLREESNMRKLIVGFDNVKSDKTITSQEAGNYINNIIDNTKHADNTQTIHMSDNVNELIDEILDCKGLPNAHRTLFTKLDSKVMMRDGNYVVMAGLPGSGKSALALNFATHFAKQGKKILYISLEMTATEMKERLISSLSGVDGKKISRREGLTSDEKLMIAATAKTLKQYDIRFFDRGSITVEHLMNLCTKLKQQGQLDILITDHIGLMRCANKQLSKTQSTSFISQTLKQIAMTLKITVITLSQFNRNSIDSNTGKTREPNLTDLKDSNSLGEDANIALLLYAPKPNEEFANRHLVLKIAKNRSGELGKILMVFKTESMQFREMDYNDGNAKEIGLDIFEGE